MNQLGGSYGNPRLPPRQFFVIGYYSISAKTEIIIASAIFLFSQIIISEQKNHKFKHTIHTILGGNKKENT